MAKRKTTTQDTPVCQEVRLPEKERLQAAFRAIAINPANAPANTVQPTHISVMTQKFWGTRASDLTIGFMESTTTTMRNKVLAYANRWGEFSSAKFQWTKTSPMIRISFGRGGYYSYLGTDCLSVSGHTMNLESFTVNTPDSEWERVVIHEFGHALGCPHEQQRKEILDLLDVQKTIAYFWRTQRWDEQQVRQQILTPLEDFSLMGASPNADQTSIMCYEFPGSITKSGQPIVGGHTLSTIDREYFAKSYPPSNPPPPPPLVQYGDIMTLIGQDAYGNEVTRFKRSP